MNFIQTELDHNHKVLMVLDGVSYYCGGRCIPDIDFSLLAYIYKNTSDMDSFSDQLNALGVTHILVNSHAVRTFTNNFDNNQNSHPLDNDASLINNFLLFLQLDFLPVCSHEIYRDQYEKIYELTCQNRRKYFTSKVCCAPRILEKTKVK